MGGSWTLEGLITALLRCSGNALSTRGKEVEELHGVGAGHLALDLFGCALEVALDDAQRVWIVGLLMRSEL